MRRLDMHPHISEFCTNDTLSPPRAAPLQFPAVAVRFALFANLALQTKCAFAIGNS